MSEVIHWQRTDLKIESDRNLYSYTFADSNGKALPPEPTLSSPKPSQPADDAHGNLNSEEGEKRPG